MNRQPHSLAHSQPAFTGQSNYPIHGGFPDPAWARSMIQQRVGEEEDG